MCMIKAIIFDCFGVLTTDAWLPFKNEHFKGNTEHFDRAGVLNQQSDAGLIGYDDFLREIGYMAGMTGQQVEAAISNNVPNHDLFNYIRELKPEYKIGLLSNASGDWLGQLFAPAELEVFDATALSYDTKRTKPAAEAYQIIADRLGEAVEDCVFIDDQDRFVTGAQDAGMRAIWFKGNDQLRQDLQELLTNSKR